MRGKTQLAWLPKGGVCGFVAGLALIFSINAHPWGEDGHMIATQVALNILGQTHPELDPYIKNLRKTAENFVRSVDMDEKQVATVVQASTFLDTYAYSKAGGSTHNWHYINLPYVPEGQEQFVDSTALQKDFAQNANVALELATSLGNLTSSQSNHYEWTGTQ